MYQTSNVKGTINRCAQIAVNKSLLKEYTVIGERVVYLKNGDNFQIQLFNNTPNRMGVKIYINGQEIDGMLVVRPGERCWLERFINENKKFVFNTYEVEANDEEVSKAIANNGEIKIKFYKEKTTSTSMTINNWSQWITLNEPYYGYPNISVTNLNNVMPNLNERYFNDIQNCCYTTFSEALPINEKADTTNMSLLSETGRIEKGNASSQKLDSIDVEFETYPEWTEVIRILPISQKQVSVNDMQKTYCTECGRKISPKFKFCPFCGNKCE